MNDNPTTMEEGMALLDAAVAASQRANEKFAPKLTFHQRCEILALRRKGCTRESLAHIYNVDVRTVTHIYNEHSPRYKNVREEELTLGRDNFILKYLNPELLVKAASLLQPEEKEENNKRSNGKAGIHTVRNEYCDYDHRVIIQWIERGEQEHVQVSGWYYKDLDSEWPDQWSTPFGVDDALKTSQACYTAMLADISDKMT